MDEHSDYERRSSPEFREKFGAALADISHIKEKLGEHREMLDKIADGQNDVRGLKGSIDGIIETLDDVSAQLKKHIEDDVPINTLIFNKLYVVFVAVLSMLGLAIANHYIGKIVAALEVVK